MARFKPDPNCPIFSLEGRRTESLCSDRISPAYDDGSKADDRRAEGMPIGKVRPRKKIDIFAGVIWSSGKTDNR